MYSANIVTENGKYAPLRSRVAYNIFFLGDSFIPASQRPDGTWRKARRVKEGYVPQEEVPLYESRGKQFVNRQSKPAEPVRLPSGHTAHTSIPGLFILDNGKEKKQQQSVAKKKSKSNVAAEESVTKQLQNVKITEKQPSKQKQEQREQSAIDPAKRLKNLKKKVREIESLEEKLKKGEITKPEPEQLAKIKRKNDLLLEINQLEKKI